MISQRLSWARVRGWVLGILIAVGAILLLRNSAVGQSLLRRVVYGAVYNGMSRATVERLLGQPRLRPDFGEHVYYSPFEHPSDLIVPTITLTGPIEITYSNGSVISKRWLTPEEQRQAQDILEAAILSSPTRE